VPVNKYISTVADFKFYKRFFTKIKQFSSKQPAFRLLQGTLPDCSGAGARHGIDRNAPPQQR